MGYYGSEPLTLPRPDIFCSIYMLLIHFDGWTTAYDYTGVSRTAQISTQWACARTMTSPSKALHHSSLHNYPDYGMGWNGMGMINEDNDYSKLKDELLFRRRLQARLIPQLLKLILMAREAPTPPYVSYQLSQFKHKPMYNITLYHLFLSN